MLQLYARLKVIPASRHNRSLSDALSSAESSQRLIGQQRAAGCQLLMDSHEIAFAGSQKVEDLLPVRFGFLRPLDLRHERGVGSQNLTYGLA